MPLGFANDAKIPPHRVTRAPLSRAEHPYKSCNRRRCRQRDIIGGIQPQRGLLRIPSQEALVEGQEFTVVEHDSAADHHGVNR